VDATDAEVIARSVDDPPMFALLFDRHAGTVFRFLVRRVGRDTADELMSDVFRIAFERRSAFDVSRPNARPWLYGIATHLVSKHRRTEGRRLRATGRLSADESPDLIDAVAGVVDATHLWPIVARGIAELPDGERDAMLLYAWEELSYDEIAAALEIPVGTVRSRLNRARKRLRELTGATGEHHIAAAERARIEP
jgi:RNA polymerase sigma factor (sigma-70 family)